MSSDGPSPNPFQASIEAGLHGSASVYSTQPLHPLIGTHGWSQTSDSNASAIGLMQTETAVIDVTDKGIKILPLMADGRIYAQLGFVVAASGEALQPSGITLRPGEYRLEGRATGLGAWTLRLRPARSLPGLAADLDHDGPERVVLNPIITWLPRGVPVPSDGAMWLQLRRTPHRNSILLCDRPFRSEEYETLVLDDVELQRGVPLRFWLMACARTQVTELMEALEKAAEELAYWPDMGRQLDADTPDEQVNRQAAFSLHNSLFSRAARSDGGEIFVHGRRDHGYGDCAKPHQSYQMHLPALAAGAGVSVRAELMVFASMVDENGALDQSPRPGAGSHPYPAPYSNAHFLLAIDRYLSWTGDWDFLAAKPEGQSKSVAEVARMVADWLIARRRSGLIQPCGWLDAWPPNVVAQAQVSIVTSDALARLGRLLNISGNDGETYESAAEGLRARVIEVFYQSETGLFAEHLISSGEVLGGSPEDFFPHTQIWAALTGVATDRRGLELCRQLCLRPGMRAITETSFNRPYIASSTDGLDDLSTESTKTWLLASWPELTHLYALAEIMHGEPDLAWEAVKATLPERLRQTNPNIWPHFYAEKYLTPHLTPWLCTWGGDPTLWEVILAFAGVHAEIEGMRILPAPPRAWAGRETRLDFQWRGERRRLTLRASGVHEVEVLSR